jgi:hypothetical protein
MARRHTFALVMAVLLGAGCTPASSLVVPASSLVLRAPAAISRRIRERLRRPLSTAAEGRPGVSRRAGLLQEPPREPADQGAGDDDERALRALLVPVWLSVFCHMLGVGITLSQLSLYMTSLGATPSQLGLAISGFSVAQMFGCPLLISLSSRYGRLAVMRVCLAGNAAASLLTAWAGSWTQIAAARVLAGFFAASVPVSQAAVTDVVQPGPATTQALSQVAAATSLGIVAGPAVAGLVSEVAAGVFKAPAHLLTPIVFATSGSLDQHALCRLSAAKFRLASLARR